MCVHTYNGALLSLKKNAILTHAVTWTLKTLAKWNKAGTENKLIYDSTYTDLPRTVEFYTETESSIVVTRHGKEE